MNALLAKSGAAAPTIAAHNRDVRAAAETIVASVGRDLTTAAPSLPDNFIVLLVVSALLHDLLKANSAFQEMVTNGRRLKQPIRHEALAAVLLATPGPLNDWFLQMIPDEADRWAVVWAIAGHHFQMPDPAKPDAGSGQARPIVRGDSERGRFKALLSDQQVNELLAETAALFRLGTSPARLDDIPFDTADDEDDGLRERVRRYVNDSATAWQRYRNNPEVRTRIALLKALLIAADVSGSAVTERGERPEKWVRRMLDIRLSPEDLVPVVRKGTKGKDPLPFQVAVGASDRPVTLVAAGCGNGKTTAAYLWAQRWAANKKLFFTYPTTGTATAGYAGYLANQHELLSDLIHMRAAVDLEAIRGTPEDREEAAARIDSLRVWDRKVVVCTVDTVLGLLQAQRRPVYSFPAFAAGAFVFDEVHSYDHKLFGGLLRFLQEFPGVPALIMSASISPGRLARLREVLGNRGGEVIKGDQDLEGYKRYRLEGRDSAEACWNEVADALAVGKKVLWVCNTVGNAIRAARDLGKRTGVMPIVYHSQFRYRDRVNRQNELIAAFRGNSPVLAVTTQVCEMSLDISADLLVTAECPLPALVQRLGRLNRYASADDPWQALVYPFEGLPYNEDSEKASRYGDYSVSMRATRETVKELAGQPCSQRDLAERLDRMHDNEQPDTYSMLFDGGWMTDPMPVRAGSDYGLTVIWKRDLLDIATKLGSDRRKWTAGKLTPWTIPMNTAPRKLVFEEYAGPYPIAAETNLDYTIEEGGQWKPN